MRTVDEHQAAVLSGLEPLAAVDVPLLDAVGQVAASEVRAAWPLPSFDNSSMDGYAVIADDLTSASVTAPVSLAVVGDVAAGDGAAATVTRGHAMRIMTGAPMPAGADAVVPVEATDGGVTHVMVSEPVPVGACIRRAGEDVATGDVVVRVGDVVTTRVLPVLAAVGCATVSVVARPRVVVISTGDELVEPGTPLTRGQISDTNGTMLVALCRSMGAIAHRAPLVRDNDGEFRAALAAAVADADVVVTSGGVSMGAYDTVKEVLRRDGGVEFVKVAMNPGMPQGQGRLGEGRVPIITLPGNPVSSFVSCELFVRPVIRRLMGHAVVTRPTEQVVCVESFNSSAGKQQYARGWLEIGADGVRTVRPVGGQGSHVMGGLAQANALNVVPPEVNRVESGDVVNVIDLQREQS